MTRSRSSKSSISFPPGHQVISAMPVDEGAVNFAKTQLGAPTPAMQKFFNGAGSQNGSEKKKRVNKRKSNDEVSFFSLGMSRSTLDAIEKIKQHIPIPRGKSKPDFSKEEYINQAVERQIKIDEKKIKNGKKLNYSRR